jgi:hypothetical protein
LVGSTINVETGQWIDTTSHISGGIDSYYEYLLKSWLLFEDKDCKRMWEASVKAINKYLADNTRQKDSLGFDVLLMAQALERSGDHAKNLAEELYSLIEGHTLRHLPKRAVST